MDDEYVGYKWGIFVRAPEIFFKFYKLYYDALVPLGEIAEIKRGVTSGCDTFFFPKDITDEVIASGISDRDLKDIYGLIRNEVDDIRIIRSGDGSVHLIEKKYLEPEIHGLMDIKSVGPRREHLDRSIVLISTKYPKTDRQVRKYIRWGEQEHFNERSTVQGRISGERKWYDLTERRRGQLIWPKLQQYRHVVAYNSEGLTTNCNLYDIFVESDEGARLLCAVLNSTIVALMKFLFGSQMGREGNQVTEIFDVNMLLVPNPHRANHAVARRLQSALAAMRERNALPLVDVDGAGDEWSGELALPDRQELDDAVLELLGIDDADVRRTLRAELYAEMTKLYREIRATEKKMQKFRAQTTRHGRPTPKSIADEIWDSYTEKPIAKTLQDFVPPDAPTETVVFPALQAKAVARDMFNPHSLKFNAHYVPLGSPERVAFGLRLSEEGISGKVTIPIDPKVATTALDMYRAHVAHLNEIFQDAASAYTADEKMQERIAKELWRHAGQH